MSTGPNAKAGKITNPAIHSARPAYAVKNIKIEDSALMPFIRQLPKIGRKVGANWSAEQTATMEALQIADLRHIHRHYRNSYILPIHGGNVPKLLAELCSGDEFNEKLAREIAETGVKGSKATELGIREAHQWELCNLRTGAIGDAQHRLLLKYANARARLFAMAARDQYVRFNEDEWALVWLAGELLDIRSGLLGIKATEAVSSSELAQVHKLLGGEEIAPAGVRKKLKSVRARIDFTAASTSAEISSKSPRKHRASTPRAPDPQKHQGNQRVNDEQARITL